MNREKQYHTDYYTIEMPLSPDHCPRSNAAVEARAVYLVRSPPRRRGHVKFGPCPKYALPHDNAPRRRKGQIISLTRQLCLEWVASRKLLVPVLEINGTHRDATSWTKLPREIEAGLKLLEA